MAVDVAIELDEPDWADPEWSRHYVAGNILSGVVRVRSDQEVNCRGVHCVVGWHTEGRGDKDEGIVWSNTLHEGPLSGEQTFPFRLTLPLNGPISYSGHYIRIVWTVNAVVALDWQKDPSAEVLFFLMPAPFVESERDESSLAS